MGTWSCIVSDSEFETGLERELTDPLYRRDRYDIQRRREVTALICELFDRWQINGNRPAKAAYRSVT
jgi:hypothetical protein